MITTFATQEDDSLYKVLGSTTFYYIKGADKNGRPLTLQLYFIPFSIENVVALY